MALTPSTMRPLGSDAPDFDLPDTQGNRIRLADTQGRKATVVAFWCNHCPYVKHLKEALASLAREFDSSEVGFVAINANDVANYPDDSPEKMAEDAARFAYPFPYLFDESQEIARAYDAACTPDFFLYDADLKLRYRGQFDNSRPSNDEPVTGADLRSAIDAVVAGQPVPEPQLPSMGCNIKWKA